MVESKNASAVRRNLGREHIPAVFAPLVQEFASRVPSPHLNYHRPCCRRSRSRFATALQSRDDSRARLAQRASLLGEYNRTVCIVRSAMPTIRG